MQRDKRGNTCLHLAGMRLNISCLRFLLKYLFKNENKKFSNKEFIQKYLKK